VFLKNSWYVAAWSKEVVDRPLARRILDEAIVVFRGNDGQLGALADHCPHRHLPLSMGCVTGDNLQCGYHGMTFDREGHCIRVPSQSFVPPRVSVTAYPIVERYGWVWVWMGETSAADPELIPDFHQMSSEGFASVGDTTPVKASYQLLVDNLLDLSHVGYVHSSTIGTPGMGEKGKLTVERTPRGVRVKRLVPDVPAPPVYQKSGLLPPGKNIDRFQIIEYVAPGFVIIHVGGAEAGTGVLEGRTEHGLNTWVLNAITPETATTSTYFWGNARRHALDDAAADALFFNATTEAFAEDKAVVEAQQLMIAQHGDTWSVALKQDAGSIEARRVHAKLLTAETVALVREEPFVTT
jgi:phenylpropionate dioxygenase-like ring-hydroxylating dioxygenase large terminal subunit